MSRIGLANIPSNIKTSSKPVNAQEENNNSFRLCIGVVTKYYPIDDKLNISKSIPEYDVLVIENSARPVMYRNCQQYALGGGSLNDFGEHILQDTVSTLQGKLLKSNDIKNYTGTFVLLLFLDGIKEKPLIIAEMQHGSRPSKATKAMGRFLEREFQGHNLLIDKDGNLTLELVGNKDEKGKLIYPAPIGTFIKVTKDGQVIIKDNEDQMISIDRVAKLITITDGSGESMVIDKTKQSMFVDIGKDVIQNIGKDHKETIKNDHIEIVNGEHKETIDKNKTEESGPRKTTVKGLWQIKASKIQVDTGELLVTNSGNTTITTTGNTTINGTGPIAVNGTGGITLTDPNAITLTAPAITLAGAVVITGGFAASGGSGGSITGNLSVTGNVTMTGAMSSGSASVSGALTAGSVSAASISGASIVSGSIDLATHIHSGVTPGTGNSGPPT
jgi:hypothetical protein